MLTLIGDVHGQFSEYRKILKETEGLTVQLGDMGLGFGMDRLYPFDKDHEGEHRFVRGNHDNPEICRQYKSYLGDYGCLTDVSGEKPSYTFYVGGGWSIDQNMRTEGKTWWRDEELDYEGFKKANSWYRKTLPSVMLSHECPYSVVDQALGDQRGWGGDIVRTRTNSALQCMFEIHQPKLWVFAHYHRSAQFEHNGTKFVCLNELEVYEV